MSRLLTRYRYWRAKYEYACAFTVRARLQGKLHPEKECQTRYKKMFFEKMTFCHWNEGVGMKPLFGYRGGQLLVRKIAKPDATTIRVGDVVVHKDPRDLVGGKLLVGRIAAIGDEWEILSTDKNEPPYSLGEDECWVVADNKNSEGALSSYDFGSIDASYIVGRAIFCLRSAVDYGLVNNSEHSKRIDLPVVEMELDLDKLITRPNKNDDDSDDNGSDHEDDYMER